MWELQEDWESSWDVVHQLDLSGKIVALYGLGFVVFRGANGQKDMFRRNPNDPKVAHLSYLQTKRGTRLLTSGWWGMARKINYTGDWLMGLSWCLCTGFGHIVPYFYAIYFAILLIHRASRDDEQCSKSIVDGPFGLGGPMNPSRPS